MSLGDLGTCCGDDSLVNGFSGLPGLAGDGLGSRGVFGYCKISFGLALADIMNADAGIPSNGCLGGFGEFLPIESPPMPLLIAVSL